MPAFNLTTDTTVSATSVISTAATGGFGYLISQSPAPNFTNFGDISFSQAAGQSGAVGLQLAAGSLNTAWTSAAVDNEGHFTVTAAGSATFLAGPSAPSITNGGVITVTAGGQAEGVHVQDQLAHLPVSVDVLAPRFTNPGQLVVSGGGSATGLYLGDGGGVFNDGLIRVTATSAGAAAHGIWSEFGGIVDNSGQIIVTDSDPNLQSVALHFGGSGTVSVQNHGTITADIAFEDTNTVGVDGHTVGIDNFGVINGRIILSEGTFPIANSTHGIANDGVINGDVDLGPGDDLFDGAMGTQTGLVSGGLGNDVLKGGPGRDSLQGNQGNDTEHGGAGDDIVVGGKDNDVQSGDDGDDVVWGNLGNDTLDGGDGADQVRGGQGDDVISGGAGNDYISGDRGNDTETGGPGADMFHSFSGAGIDRVLDFNYSEGDRVMLDPGTAYTLKQAGADAVVDMGNGDQVILVGVQLSSLPSDFVFLSF